VRKLCSLVLRDRLRSLRVRSGGLRVYTTIDPRLQRFALEAIRRTLPYRTDPAAAIVSINPANGAVINPGNPRGCLLTNTSLAFGTGSARIDKHVGAKIKAMETLLEQAIARARDDGQIPAAADARQLARFYSAVAQSLGVMHKAFGDAAALRDIVTVAMRSWPGRDDTSRRSAATSHTRRPGRSN